MPKLNTSLAGLRMLSISSCSRQKGSQYVRQAHEAGEVRCEVIHEYEQLQMQTLKDLVQKATCELCA
jgi:hypothetical protein